MVNKDDYVITYCIIAF